MTLLPRFDPEQQWMWREDPLSLFELVEGGLSERKLRCLIGGVTHLLANELPGKYRADAITAAESLATGEKHNAAIDWLRAELHRKAKLPSPVRRRLGFVVSGLNDDLRLATRTRLREVLSQPPLCAVKRVEAVLRCICGNPFRPVTFDPAWRTSDVVALARGIYDDRAFDRMPILADALQDAGCTNEDILNHCRDTATPHARGCWVVDLVLGKA